MKPINLRYFLSWVFGQLQRFRVRGDSMSPTLMDGDWVFIRKKRAQPGGFHIGDILVARHPYTLNSYVVKRLDRFTANGFYLTGDNPTESTDSRTLGAFPPNIILGKVEVKWTTSKSN